MSILETIKQFITKHTLIKRNDTIIIGLSGGPDSVFLLHTFVALQEKYNLTLIAAHLNHEWRAEADSEQQLCQTIAAQFNIPFVTAKLSSLSQNKKYNGSKEEFARHMRRQFLQSVLHEHNAHSIALGHHAQDQQETFFIRLIRGTSLAGLTGMHPKHGLYIRPLLETNKADILQWLNTHNITYAVDASNASPNYLRNRIRSTVLPALTACDERWNNNFLTTLNRIQQDDALLNEIALTTLHNLIETIDDKRTLNVSPFIATNPSLRHRIIILWLIHNNVQFPTTQAFLDEIIRFLCNPSGGTHTIHEQWSLVKKQGKVFILKI
ncbi:MAG TPA: tRNA lysidine(34) synthetase TilS [Candidatus Babeliales bacterium]|nr:tRNA lysidine(34) synthetase TilS [Candidatus Babeliales bacterium]